LLPDLEVFTTDDDLSVLVHATELICSLSTYCWWGAFLGDHETVVVPDKYSLYKVPARMLGWKKVLTEEEDEFKDGNPDFVGEWKVDHEDWSETMILSKEGTFHRVQSSWENGKWQVTEDGVSLKWQNWAEEKAKYNNGKLIGERFLAYRPWRLVNPKISYCTTCKGRLWQLSQTYLKNIQTALNEYNNVEFILLDYQSSDGLEEWAKNELRKYVENGVVKYVKLMDDLPWHVSKAKNMAHRVASGRILCNLDADNFLGDGFTKKISYEVAAKRAIRLTGHESVGGRIAVYKDDFFIIGGYDEAFAPMGYQDVDLEIRLVADGVKVLHLPTGPLPVGNSDEQRAEFCGMSYKECCVKSRDIMRANASAGRIVANVTPGDT